MKIYVLLLLATFLMADNELEKDILFGVKYWKLPQLTYQDLISKNKDKNTYKKWIQDNHYFSIISNVTDEHAIKSINTFNKSVCSNSTSTKDNRKTCVLMSPQVESKIFVKVYNYIDIDKFFLNRPAQFTINDSIGFIVLDITDNHYLREEEIPKNTLLVYRNINKILEKFSKQSGLKKQDIIVLGNFGITKELLEKYIEKDFVVELKTGSKIINEKQLVSTDHIIYHKEKKIKSPEIQYNVALGKTKKEYLEKVAEHYPFSFRVQQRIETIK